MYYGERISNDERRKLFDEVWADPVQVVAKRYEVSDVALSKRCKKFSIPLPGRGYWAKKVAGKELPAKPELPKVDCELSERVHGYAIVFKNTDSWADEELVKQKPLHFLEPQSVEIIKSYTANLEIEKQLRDPTKWTQGLMDAAEKSRKEEKEEIARRRNNYWLSNLPEPKPKIHYPFIVGSRNEKRVLRILDTLDKTLYEIEAKICASEKFWRRGNEYEQHLRISVAYALFDLWIAEDKSDRLTFHFGDKDDASRSIKLVDKGDETIESRLGTAIYNLIVIVDKEYGLGKLHSREWHKKLEEEERKRKIRKRQEEEQALYDRLLTTVNAWSEAERLRNFVDALERKLDGVEDNETKESLIKYVDWVRLKADWADPLTGYNDEILGEGNGIWIPK